MTNTERIEQIKQRLEAATPGPWESHLYGGMKDGEWEDHHCAIWTPGPPGSFFLNAICGRDPIVWDEKYLTSENAELIAHAPSDLAFAIAEIERKDAEMGAVAKVTGATSDGYHTFDELYEHRTTLFIAWVKALVYLGEASILLPWKSRKHSDGTMFDGWFIMGVGIAPGDQITYHLPLSKWDETSFVREIERAPDFDGHTSADVLKRIQAVELL